MKLEAFHSFKDPRVESYYKKHDSWLLRLGNANQNKHCTNTVITSKLFLVCYACLNIPRLSFG
ncbi:hypothetical protein RchiOBHm_Chr2g0155931 [Rosa chinensis]|uniref:Uncharacterized protein n=1 Tax=Rosa chinensis TaxID=74649 RepID=A0A2P6S1C5_ROSCH|nr:hypothetical protein RchiOBHm_Chr2g0155931 [Rosa chinensis]